MRKTIKTHVVGLQHSRLNEGQIADLQRGADLRLARDPHNPHDHFAVEVYLGSRRIGFIRRVHARTVAPALDTGLASVSIAIDDPSSIARDAKAIPVTIEIHAMAKPPEPSPRVSPSQVAGIYRLRLMHTSQSYIGQAGDVNDRVSNHWRELSLGVHSNYKLQQYWKAYGASGITVELVEAVPPGHSPFHQQMWLGRREKFWIKQERAAGTCVNLQDGDFVLTPAAIAERDALMQAPPRQAPTSDTLVGDVFLQQLEEALDARHQLHDRQDALRRERLLADELQEIGRAAPSLDRERQQLQVQVSTLEEQLKPPTGLLGLFSRRRSPAEIAAITTELQMAEQALANAKQRCVERDARRLALQKELRNLKAHYQG